MASLFSRRLLWLLGCFPLLSADFAVAVSLAQVSNSRRLADNQNHASLACSPDELQRDLEAGDWQQLVSYLEGCDLDPQVTPLAEIVGRLRSGVQSASERQQIVALYGFQVLATELAKEQFDHEDPAVTDFDNGDPVATDVVWQAINWLIGSIEPEQTHPLTLTSRAIATDTLAVLATSLIIYPESGEYNWSELIDSLVDIAAPLKDAEASPDESNLIASPEDAATLPDERLQMSATEALRDIGRALQVRADRQKFEGTQPTPVTEAPTVISKMVAQLSNALAASHNHVNENEADSATRLQLSSAVQTSQAEALGAFLFLLGDNGGERLTPSEFLLLGGPLSDEDLETLFASLVGDNSSCQLAERSADEHGIQLLNCLSAQQQWQIADNETIDMPSSLRAAAIAELERLGNFPAFRGALAEQLRQIALSGSNSISPEDRNRHFNDWTNERTDIRVGAVESMARVQQLEDRRRPTPRAWEDRNREANARNEIENYRLYNLPFPSDLELLILLADGLESSDLDEESATAGSDVPELQQRAEIAFAELYDRDFARLANAIRYAKETGNLAIQRSAIKSLGAVNYQNQRDEAELTLMSQFLGFSLMCSPEAEVRRDAAFALSQLASHRPHLLKAQLETEPDFLLYQGTQWAGFLPDRDVVPDLDEPFIERCQAFSADKDEEDETAKEDSPNLKVMDALMLRFQDREENIIVTAALALSRYGLALRNDLYKADFAQQDSDALASEDLDRLKACLHALVSPTRFKLWREELNEHNDDLMYAPLVTSTEGYVSTCGVVDASGEPEYTMPEENTSAAAIAAAFVLGQLGISDGESEASIAERESVAFLLRSLRGLDLMNQHEAGTETPETITSVATLQAAHPYREDALENNVREAIVSYALSQIHPREHSLVTELIDAVSFEQPATTEGETPERTLSCQGLVPDDDYFVCIDNPITRAAVIGAVEVIGLEALNQLGNPITREDEIERQEQYEAQRLYVQTYLSKARQLLTQDVTPVLTEAVATTVVERIMALSSNADNQVAVEPDPGDAEPVLSIQQNIAATRYTLALPFTSLYSCAGATYGLARLGVYNDATVNQLVNYLFAYPQPWYGDTVHGGNFCMPGEPGFGETEINEDLPSTLEQLIILKTGAIAALGGIELHDLAATRIYPRDAIRAGDPDVTALGTPTTFIEDDTVDAITQCLIQVANLERLLEDDCQRPREPVKWSSANIVEAQNLEFSNSEIEDFQAEGFAFEDVRLAHTEFKAGPQIGFDVLEILNLQVKGFAFEDIRRAHAEREDWQQFNFDVLDIAYFRRFDLTPDDLTQEELDDWLSFYDLTEDDLKSLTDLRLSNRDVAEAKGYGLTPEDIDKGERAGILPKEIIQAAKWGVTPEEFFILKLQLQEPVIAAIGQLALNQRSTTAVKALNPDDPGNPSTEIITGRSSRGIQGIPVEEIKNLKLENLAAILQAIDTPSSNRDHRHGVNNIDDDVVAYLIDLLKVDDNAYAVADNINDYFAQASDGDELGTIQAPEIDVLADGLRQEVYRLVRQYQRAHIQIPEDIKRVFPRISEAQFKAKQSTQRAELRRDYTQRLQERAAEILQAEKGFRDQALSVLVSLRTETISNLDVPTRQALVETLGIGDRHTLTAERCLIEPDIFERERLCHGVSRLVTAALDSNLGTDDQAIRIDSREFLQSLAAGEQETTTPVIRSNAIEYLGDLDGFTVGYSDRQEIYTTLIARLADDDEAPGTIENAIQTYYDFGAPETGVSQLLQTLSTAEQQADSPTEAVAQLKAAAQMAARLGRLAHENPDTTGTTEVALGSDEVADFRNLSLSSDNRRWQEELQNTALVAELVRVARTADDLGVSTDLAAELQSTAISAIGHIRTNDEAAIALLRATLLDRQQPLENRLAAAYALGNIMATHPAIATDLSNELRELVRNDGEDDELRVVAAFALSKVEDGIAANLPLAERMEIAYKLIHLYEDLEAETASSAEPLINRNSQKAIILYALSQVEIDEDMAFRPNETDTPLAVRNLNDRLNEIYAEAIADANNPIAVRAMAATYAHTIPLWSADLIDALATAFTDNNLAVRFGAVNSVRQQQEDALRSLYADSRSPLSLHEIAARLFDEDVFTALSEIFWNEREFALVRLTAGQALKGPFDPNSEDDLEQRYFTTHERYVQDVLELNPDDQQYADLLVIFEALEESEISYRAIGSDAILQALRSAELLAAFNDIDLDEALLLEILEAIREDGWTLIRVPQPLLSGEGELWVCYLVPSDLGNNRGWALEWLQNLIQGARDLLRRPCAFPTSNQNENQAQSSN